MYQANPEQLVREVRLRLDDFQRRAQLNRLAQVARQPHRRPVALRQKIGWTLIRWGTSLAQGKA